jgi:hypothetical protein
MICRVDLRERPLEPAAGGAHACRVVFEALKFYASFLFETGLFAAQAQLVDGVGAVAGGRGPPGFPRPGGGGGDGAISLANEIAISGPGPNFQRDSTPNSAIREARTPADGGAQHTRSGGAPAARRQWHSDQERTRSHLASAYPPRLWSDVCLGTCHSQRASHTSITYIPLALTHWRKIPACWSRHTRR